MVESVYMGLSNFQNDIAYFKEAANATLKIKVEREDQPVKEFEQKLEVITEPEILRKVISLMPQDIKEKRKKIARNAAKGKKENNKLRFEPAAAMEGTKPNRKEPFFFDNMMDLKKRVKEIQAVRSDGEELKIGGGDFDLVSCLLDWHPRGPAKKEKMKGIKVDQSTHGGNRCFFVIKEDGACEDFSMVKIFDAINNNPPFVNKKEQTKQVVPAKEVPAGEEKKEEAAAEKKDEAPAAPEGEAKAPEEASSPATTTDASPVAAAA